MPNEKEVVATVPAPGSNGQKISSESKCPIAHGTRKFQTNAEWWPNQLNLKVLHQHSPLSDPMGKEFNYTEEFKSLDLDSVMEVFHSTRDLDKARDLVRVYRQHAKQEFELLEGTRDQAEPVAGKQFLGYDLSRDLFNSLLWYGLEICYQVGGAWNHENTG